MAAKTKKKPIEVEPEPSAIICPACGSDAPLVDCGEYGCSKEACGWLGTPELAETHRKNHETKSGWMGEPATPIADDPLTPEELAAYDAETQARVSQAAEVARSAESYYGQCKAEASDAKKRSDEKHSALVDLIRDRSDNRGKRPKPEAPTLLDSIPKWREYGLDKLTMLDDVIPKITEAGITTLGELSDQIGPAYNPDAGPVLGLTREAIDMIREQIHALIDAEFKQPPVESELWREFPIERWSIHGLTPKDIEKLHSGEAKGGGGHPIITVGDLNRFVTPNPANPSYTRGYADIKGIGTAGADRISEAETAFWGWWRAGGEAEFAKERQPVVEEPQPGTEAAA